MSTEKKKYSGSFQFKSIETNKKLMGKTLLLDILFGLLLLAIFTLLMSWSYPTTVLMKPELSHENIICYERSAFYKERVSENITGIHALKSMHISIKKSAAIVN